MEKGNKSGHVVIASSGSSGRVGTGTGIKVNRELSMEVRNQDVLGVVESSRVRINCPLFVSCSCLLRAQAVGWYPHSNDLIAF
jgi:hypothetical protein